MISRSLACFVMILVFGMMASPAEAYRRGRNYGSMIRRVQQAQAKQAQAMMKAMEQQAKIEAAARQHALDMRHEAMAKRKAQEAESHDKAIARLKKQNEEQEAKKRSGAALDKKVSATTPAEVGK